LVSVADDPPPVPELLEPLVPVPELPEAPPVPDEDEPEPVLLLPPPLEPVPEPVLLLPVLPVLPVLPLDPVPVSLPLLGRVVEPPLLIEPEGRVVELPIMPPLDMSDGRVVELPLIVEPEPPGVVGEELLLVLPLSHPTTISPPRARVHKTGDLNMVTPFLGCQFDRENVRARRRSVPGVVARVGPAGEPNSCPADALVVTVALRAGDRSTNGRAVNRLNFCRLCGAGPPRAAGRVGRRFALSAGRRIMNP
jgi:hypothetical protein